MARTSSVAITVKLCLSRAHRRDRRKGRPSPRPAPWEREVIEELDHEELE
jgi:hypothetical protein